MKVKSLRELYIEELKDIYDAEKELVKALPKMAKAAGSPKLQSAFESHLEQTRGHVQRLEQIFEGLGETAKTKKCVGMRGIIEEGEDVVDQDGETSVRDAGLIAGGQRAEHYEMAIYGSRRTWAGQLGDNRAVRLLQETLEEEKEADRKLTEIAESSVNTAAATGQAAR
jgi:ferritin-like metal-binding protein YciE